MPKLPQKLKLLLRGTALAAMTGLGVAAIAAAPAVAQMHSGHGGAYRSGGRAHGSFHGGAGFRGGYYGGGWHGREIRGGGWHEDWDEPDWDDFAVVAAPWPYNYYGPYCDYWDYYYGYCD